MRPWRDRYNAYSTPLGPISLTSLGLLVPQMIDYTFGTKGKDRLLYGAGTVSSISTILGIALAALWHEANRMHPKRAAFSQIDAPPPLMSPDWAPQLEIFGAVLTLVYGGVCFWQLQEFALENGLLVYLPSALLWIETASFLSMFLIRRHLTWQPPPIDESSESNDSEA